MRDLLSFLLTAGRMAWAAWREGRLPLSPRRWLLDLRHLRGVMGDGGVPQPAPRREVLRKDIERVRREVTEAAAAELEAFLQAGETLALPSHAAPAISVVIVLFNRAELTLRCLRSLEASAIPLEVVLVDNASSDKTAELLDRTTGAVVIRRAANDGFSVGVNTGAAAARGDYLLLLNSDTELRAGSLEAALETAQTARNAGAVGGKLVLPDDSLQEAGCVIWKDGSCFGYGRGDDPDAPAYSFTRDVDLCSAAFLLTPRQLFLEMGGFHLEFSPAYYEDVDYCVRLWRRGKRVIYEPAARVRHFEFASTGSRAAAEQRQLEKRRSFVAKHGAWLESQPVRDPARVLWARQRPVSGAQRVLVFDDRVPHRRMGSGFPRAVELVEALVGLGHAVTFYPLSFPDEDWASVYADIPHTVEVMVGFGPDRVASVMRERRDFYDTIIVSRHHNMERLRAVLGDVRAWGARVIYDAEAVSAGREVARRRLSGESIDAATEAALVQQEVDLARDVDSVFAVSEGEREVFLRAGIPDVHILSHAVEVAPTNRTFAERNGLLFVGAFDPLSPNIDAAHWLVEEILPKVNEFLGFRPPVFIAGQHAARVVGSLASDQVSIVDAPDDLTALYDRVRVFVAPARYAAGIPLKVLHAAAHGVPVVCTTLLTEQLGWTADEDLCCAGDPDGFSRACATLHCDETFWTRVRANALERVASGYSHGVFRDALGSAITGLRKERCLPPRCHGSITDDRLRGFHARRQCGSRGCD